jgi:hypothetical protein
VFGAGFFAVAPFVTNIADEGSRFRLIAGVFAIGLHMSVWFFVVIKILRSLEEVHLFNVTVASASRPLNLLLAVYVYSSSRISSSSLWVYFAP